VACETASKKMENKTGKAGCGDTRSGSKTPTDEDNNDTHSWKKKVNEVKRHIEKECPEKTAFQEFVAQRKAKTAIPCYSAFDHTCGFGNEDFIPYYSTSN
jgi:hypothetical protein